MKNKLLTVVVGSQNPVKINAAKSAIATVFPNAMVTCQGMHAPSNVADQPMTEKETRLGAVNRVNYCQQHAKANFYVAIEGGVEQFEDGAATFAYVVIQSENQRSIGRSANLPLPKSIFESLVQGEELGHVMDRVFNTDNIKQKGGAMALLTNNNVTRESVYTLALILALAPFMNEQLFNA